MLIYIPHRISKSNAYNAINTKVSSLDYDIRFGQIAPQLGKKKLITKKNNYNRNNDDNIGNDDNILITIKILLLLLL